jgi:hypothetical protein
MSRNHPVISTAKVRGLIKKNGIGYVDATRRLYPSIAYGVSVWQLCDNVYFEVYGGFQKEKIQKTFQEFEAALNKEGFGVEKGSGSYKIVKVA